MNPAYIKYSCKIYAKSGTVYDVTEAVTSMRLSESENELAQKAAIEIVNILVNGTWFIDQVDLGDQVIIFAFDDETSNREVFRGTIWDWDYKSSDKKLLTITAYDHLIYTQNSKDNRYYAAGKSTKAVISDVASDWGIPIDYQYSSITHEKLIIKGKTISDIFIDLLDEAKKKSGGGKYVIRSEKGTMRIMRRGSNSQIYQFEAKENTMNTSHKKTLDGVVTKVLITGKEGKDKRTPVEATVTGNTELGTLQEIITRDSDTTLGDAKKEASGILAEKGAPKETFGFSAPDVPWIRKGDAVYVHAGNLSGSFYVLSISHDCVKKTMDVDIEQTASASSASTSTTASRSSSASGKTIVKVQTYDLQLDPMSTDEIDEIMG